MIQLGKSTARKVQGEEGEDEWMGKGLAVRRMFTVVNVGIKSHGGTAEVSWLPPLVLGLSNKLPFLPTYVTLYKYIHINR